jgi:hypothetical protein
VRFPAGIPGICGLNLLTANIHLHSVLAFQIAKQLETVGALDVSCLIHVEFGVAPRRNDGVTFAAGDTQLGQVDHDQPGRFRKTMTVAPAQSYSEAPLRGSLTAILETIGKDFGLQRLEFVDAEIERSTRCLGRIADRPIDRDAAWVVEHVVELRG